MRSVGDMARAAVWRLLGAAVCWVCRGSVFRGCQCIQGVLAAAIAA